MKADNVHLAKSSLYSIEEKVIKDILFDSGCRNKIKSNSNLISNIIKYDKLDKNKINLLNSLILKNKIQCIGCRLFEKCKLVTLAVVEVMHNTNICTPNNYTIIKKYQWLRDLFYDREQKYYYDNYDILAAIQIINPLLVQLKIIDTVASKNIKQRKHNIISERLHIVKTTITSSVSLDRTELNYLYISIVSFVEILFDILKKFNPNQVIHFEYRIRNIKAAYYRIFLFSHINNNSSISVTKANDFVKRCKSVIIYSEEVIEEIKDDFCIDFT